MSLALSLILRPSGLMGKVSWTCGTKKMINKVLLLSKVVLRISNTFWNQQDTSLLYLFELGAVTLFCICELSYVREKSETLDAVAAMLREVQVCLVKLGY